MSVQTGANVAEREAASFRVLRYIEKGGIVSAMEFSGSNGEGIAAWAKKNGRVMKVYDEHLVLVVGDYHMAMYEGDYLVKREDGYMYIEYRKAFRKKYECEWSEAEYND